MPGSYESWDQATASRNLWFENFDLVGAHYQISKLSLKTGSFYDMVVNPVIVSSPRFIQQQGMVFEVMLF